MSTQMTTNIIFLEQSAGAVGAGAVCELMRRAIGVQ